MHERDWVIVGATPADMLKQGFRQVGRNFPVFLHPETSEEYALARTERKVGVGHTGFECHTGPEVSLDQDLFRRDLTINAMARADDDQLIDPYGGQADLDTGVLRHVSEAFGEDPLRVFRVARFAAQLPDFHVAPETLALMSVMAASGELADLPAERVWAEWAKALAAPAIHRFLRILQTTGALEPWFEGLKVDQMIGLYHRTAFTCAETAHGAIGWVHGKKAVARTTARLRVPKRHSQTALAVASHRIALTRAGQSSEKVLDALIGIGAFRSGTTAARVLSVCEICAAHSMEPMRNLIDRLKKVKPKTQAKGVKYGEQLRKARLKIIAATESSR